MAHQQSAYKRPFSALGEETEEGEVKDRGQGRGWIPPIGEFGSTNG